MVLVKFRPYQGDSDKEYAYNRNGVSVKIGDILVVEVISGGKPIFKFVRATRIPKPIDEDYDSLKEIATKDIVANIGVNSDSK